MGGNQGTWNYIWLTGLEIGQYINSEYGLNEWLNRIL